MPPGARSTTGQCNKDARKRAKQRREKKEAKKAKKKRKLNLYKPILA